MKREDLIKLAAEIFDYEFRENTPQFARIERFAKRIAEHEREECAKLCEDNCAGYQYGNGPSKPVLSPFHKECGGRHDGMTYAIAIRSRSE